jgi:Rrf2 family protein
MQINRATDYAVRVLVQLAMLPPGSKVQLADLQRSTGVRGSFLSKVLQRLVHAGFVSSHRGNGGGFCLLLDSERTSFLEVIEAMEGPTQLNQCLISGTSCERQSWCGVHPVWERAQAALRKELDSVSIAQMARDSMAILWKHPQLLAPLASAESLEFAEAASAAAGNRKESQN